MKVAQLKNGHLRKIQKIVAPPESVSDHEIISSIIQGNLEAYGSIMRRYNQRIFRVARSIVINDAAAMDVVQESHIKAFSKLNEFRGTSSFLTWLYAITRNEALMYLRKYKREVTMTIEDIHSIDEDVSNVTHLRQNDHDKSPEIALENKQLKQLINSHIDSLSEDFRIVFILRAIEQLSVKETAEILQVKEETVKTRYFRAKRLIREKFQTYFDSAGMQVYEFGGEHCDLIIVNVLSFIKEHKK